MEAAKRKMVHVSEVMAGDTILCEDGIIRTVCLKDIRKSSEGLSVHGFYFATKKRMVETLLPIIWENGIRIQ